MGLRHSFFPCAQTDLCSNNLRQQVGQQTKQNHYPYRKYNQR